jgi:hypothetical protein
MNWMICFIDCVGNEIIDLRKFVKDKSRSEVEEIAKELERELYKQDATIDWYEIHEDEELENRVKDENI